MILAADIGGTNARFMLARNGEAGIEVVDDATLLVADFPTVEDAARAFIARTGTRPLARACLAVAGPIERRTARLTNAPWTIDADGFGARLGIPDVELCNDFEAAAYGLGALPASARVMLQAGEDDGELESSSVQRRLLIGAGTGLGVAYVLGDGNDARVVAGEGGHVAFAPANDGQSELLSWLRPALGRVTAEHVLSGTGLVRLYAFAARHRGALRDDVQRDGASAVARLHAAGDADAAEALRLFTSIFGAVAGDHALSILALGGVFIGGGIAPRFRDVFADGTFVEAFRSKGPHARLMARMPVVLVCDDRLGLRGAATRALR